MLDVWDRQQTDVDSRITEKGFETRLLRAKALLRRAIMRRREHGLQ